jgi:hypothetical protein
VERVLRDLDLLDHANTQIGNGLSGGQQRRVAVGMELLGSPCILLLDEPGASLDVRLEGQLTDVLHKLAFEDRAVVAITHRTAFLKQFDRLLVMGRGGRLAFDGSPREALAHFGVQEFDAIYDRLADSYVPAATPPMRRPSVFLAASSSARVRTRPRASFAHQLRVLVERTARVLSRDRRNLAFLIVQVPVLAATSAMLFGRNAFALTAGNATKSAQLLFVLAVVATWVGAVDGVRALISERAMFVRERALGVRVGPYLVSKLLVLGALGLTQTALLAAVAFEVAPLHRSVSTTLIVVGLLALATQVALATGLLLSALVSTEDQAGSLVPLLLVPQLLCAGAIVAVQDMGSIRPLSVLMSTRWTLAGSGSALGLPAGPSADKGFLNFYGTFFDRAWSVSATILLVLLCVSASLAGWRLRSAWRQ